MKKDEEIGNENWEMMMEKERNGEEQVDILLLHNELQNYCNYILDKTIVRKIRNNDY